MILKVSLDCIKSEVVNVAIIKLVNLGFGGGGILNITAGEDGGVAVDVGSVAWLIGVMLDGRE